MDKSQPQSSLIVEDMPTLTAPEALNDDALVSAAAPSRNQFGADQWGEPALARAKKNRRSKTILSYTAFGLVSFLIFLYLSFPFNVVKEVIVSKINETFIQQRLPVRLTMASLRPKFPLGVNAEDIQLSNVNDSAANIKIGRASVSLNVLPVIIGRLDVDLRLTQSGGSLEVNFNDSFTSLLKMARMSSIRLPSGNIAVDLNSFEIRSFVANALAFVRSGNNPALQTIQAFLRTEIGGQVSGFARITLPEPGESLERATADVDFKIGQAYFEMRDETLAIPRQEFSEARIKMRLSKKSLEIPVETKLIANDLGINLSGRMNVSDNMSINDVKIKLGLILKGKIEENFKTLLPVILGCDLAKMVNGRMDVELIGNFSALSCN